MFDLPNSILSLAKSVWEHGKEVPLLNEILNAVESSVLHVIHHMTNSEQRHLVSFDDALSSTGKTAESSVENKIKPADSTYDVTALSMTTVESAVPAVNVISNCSPNVSPRPKTNMPHKKVESVKHARLSFLTPKRGSKKSSRRKSSKQNKKAKKSLSPPPPPNSEVIQSAIRTAEHNLDEAVQNVQQYIWDSCPPDGDSIYSVDVSSPKVLPDFNSP